MEGKNVLPHVKQAVAAYVPGVVSQGSSDTFSYCGHTTTNEEVTEINAR